MKMNFCLFRKLTRNQLLLYDFRVVLIFKRENSSSYDVKNTMFIHLQYIKESEREKRRRRIFFLIHLYKYEDLFQ